MQNLFRFIEVLRTYPVQHCQFHQMMTKRNMKRLWTFYDYKDRVIPNTNNGLEAVFADIKSKERVHSGLTREHRMKLIDEYISRYY